MPRGVRLLLLGIGTADEMHTKRGVPVGTPLCALVNQTPKRTLPLTRIGDPRTLK